MLKIFQNENQNSVIIWILTMDSSSSNNDSSSSDTDTSDLLSSDDSSLPEISDIIAFPAGSDLLNFGFWIIPNPEDRPMTRQMMESIPELILNELQANGYEKCSICLLDFQDGSKVRQVPCVGQHVFHEECLFTWLESKRTCPMCREVLEVDQ